jgi:proteasome lid subunit RPN8/RPN11
VRSRIDLNDDLSPVQMPGRVLHELCQHALETQPEECCGLMAGADEERFQIVYRCRNEMTMRNQDDPVAYPRDGREAFLMSDSDLLVAQRDAESRAQRVTAVYHSHVGAGAYLSEMDQEFAEHELFPFPDAAHVVIAVWERKVARVGIFERDAETGVYVGRSLEPRTP